MTTSRGRGLTLALILAVGSSAQAADETAVVTRATKLLEEISTNPKSGIPPRFLQEARGILIVPHVVENQLGIGRKKGHGVYLHRNDKGEWENPEPIEIRGGSIGVEAGRMARDLVMIYRTQEAADNHQTTQTLILSAQGTIAVSLFHTREFDGPGLDSKTKKSVLTYVRQRGVLVGAAIGGEHRWNPTRNYDEHDTPPAAQPTTTDTKATVPPAPSQTTRAESIAPSPETARLKSVLTALTSPPPAQVADTRVKDPNVSRASGTKPLTATVAPPR